MYSKVGGDKMSESFSTGNSSLELSRSTKGEYSYVLKVYFSGTTISAMRVMVDRVVTMGKYLESELEQIKSDSDIG